MKRLSFALAVVVLTPALALAHGGGVDKHGCHHDKKAGDYHCHKGDHKGMAFKSEADMMAGKKGMAMKDHGKDDEKKSEKAKEKAKK
jgi:hypothetical protein